MRSPTFGAIVVGIGGFIDPLALGVGYPDAPRIPVTDDAGRLCGIISRADLLRVHHRVMTAETRRERFFNFTRRARIEEEGDIQP